MTVVSISVNIGPYNSDGTHWILNCTWRIVVETRTCFEFGAIVIAGIIAVDGHGIVVLVTVSGDIYYRYHQCYGIRVIGISAIYLDKVDDGDNIDAAGLDTIMLAILGVHMPYLIEQIDTWRDDVNNNRSRIVLEVNIGDNIIQIPAISIIAARIMVVTLYGI